jgi:hypothetical protein
MVEAGKTQRRGGLHTESPGLLSIQGNMSKGKVQVRRCIDCQRGGAAESADSETIQLLIHMVVIQQVNTTNSFGMGVTYEQESPLDNEYVGGIYMASSVAGSCRMWPAEISPEAIGPLGDIEPLRSHLTSRRILSNGPNREGHRIGIEIYPSLAVGAGQLVWMTDRTPHEVSVGSGSKGSSVDPKVALCILSHVIHLG